MVLARWRVTVRCVSSNPSVGLPEACEVRGADLAGLRTRLLPTSEGACALVCTHACDAKRWSDVFFLVAYSMWYLLQKQNTALSKPFCRGSVDVVFLILVDSLSEAVLFA